MKALEGSAQYVIKKLCTIQVILVNSSSLVGKVGLIYKVVISVFERIYGRGLLDIAGETIPGVTHTVGKEEFSYVEF